jgi:glycolate oxidase FAD binding subunit
METRPSGATAAGLPPAPLANACVDVTAARATDIVGGCQARYVAAPASTAEAAAVLTAAAELGLTVLPRGTGSKLDWGAPPRSCDLIIDTRRLDRVLEHAAGDLVVRVQAGVRLAELATVLATAGQRLALEPPDAAASGGGTIGGLIATGAAGPLRFRYGAPRDLLIGITVVRADGIVAKAGGKVVKNVAGYDIGKLFAGSYGTLGLITEATFRLHPAPAAAALIAVNCSDPAMAESAVQTMAESPLAPAAIELDWPAAEVPITVAVLLEGDDDSVADRADRMQTLLGERATAGRPPAPMRPAEGRPGRRPLADVGVASGPFRLSRWPAEGREHDGHDGTVLRVGFWVGQLAAVLDIVRNAAAEHGLDPAIRGSAAAGLLQVEVAAQSPVAAVASFVSELRASLASLTGVAGSPPTTASAAVLRAPAKVRDAVDMWGPVPSLALMRAVKDQFDPEHRMAPGRLAGGI